MNFSPEPLPLDDYARSGSRVLRYCVATEDVELVFFTGYTWSTDKHLYHDKEFYPGYWRLPEVVTQEDIGE